MEKLYSKQQKKCKLVQAKPETVDFLLSYSKSLKVTKTNGMTFESNLN